MINRSVSRRYAQALLMIAFEKNALDQYEKELEVFAAILETEPRLKEVMDNPKVLPEDKKKLLEQVIQGRVCPIVHNFLCLIVDKRRESFFLDIISEFSRYADEARHIVDAEVRSVVALTEKDYHNLEVRLAKATGNQVRLKSIIDPTLIGGLVVRIGDTVIDGSVIKRLSLLRKRLQQAQLEGIGVIK